MTEECDASVCESCDDSPAETPSVSGRSSVEIDVDARSLGRWGAVISDSSHAAAHKCILKEIWPLVARCKAVDMWCTYVQRGAER